jgi:hypothetical protein
MEDIGAVTCNNTDFEIEGLKNIKLVLQTCLNLHNQF